MEIKLIYDFEGKFVILRYRLVGFKLELTVLAINQLSGVGKASSAKFPFPKKKMPGTVCEKGKEESKKTESRREDEGERGPSRSSFS